MIVSHRFILAFGLCGLAPLLGSGADAKKAPVLDASPSVFLNQSHSFEVVFSPDGKYIAYKPRSEKVSSRGWYILDAATKKVLHRLPPGFLTFTPDSTRLVSIRPLQTWEPLPGRPPYKDDMYDRVKIPPHQVDVYDMKTGKRLREIPLRAGQPYGIVNLSPIPTLAVSDKFLVVAAKDAVATVYDLETGKSLGDFPGKVRVHNFLVLSRDGRWLLTLDSKRTLRSWDMKTRKQDRLLYEHMDDVFAIAISPDGRYCATATRKGAFFVFDRTTGEQKAFTYFNARHPRGLAFTSDGKRIIATVEPRIEESGRPGEAPVKLTKWDMGLRLWDWQKEGPPTAVVFPYTSKTLSEWGSKGRFYPKNMTSDGNRFLSTGGHSGILLLDLKAPPPKPEPDPEPKKP